MICVLQNTLVLLELEVVLAVDVGETPLAGDDDLLAARELVTSTAEGLLDNSGVGVLGTDGKNDLADVDTGDGAVRLAPRATHASLQTIDAISMTELRTMCGKLTDRHRRTTTSC